MLKFGILLLKEFSLSFKYNFTKGVLLNLVPASVV